MNGEIVELDSDRYHADDVGLEAPSLSASIVHVLCSSSPRHAWAKHPRLNPDYERDESDTFDVGNVAHAAILEGMEIAEPVTFGDWRSNAAKAAREEIRAAGRIPLLADQYRRVAEMLSAFYLQLSQHRAQPMPFYGGAAERVAVWEDAHGVACRARLDYLHEDLSAIDDLKTTSRSADPMQYARNLYTNGGDVQAAFYRRAIQRIYDLDVPPAFRWVVVETHPPYALSVIEPGPDVLTLGEAKVEWAIGRWAELLELEGQWPAYSLDVVRAELPPWEESRWLDRTEAL